MLIFAEELQGPCNILIIRDLNIKRALLRNRQPFTAYKNHRTALQPFFTWWQGLVGAYVFSHAACKNYYIAHHGYPPYFQ